MAPIDPRSLHANQNEKKTNKGTTLETSGTGYICSVAWSSCCSRARRNLVSTHLLAGVTVANSMNQRTKFSDFFLGRTVQIPSWPTKAFRSRNTRGLGGSGIGYCPIMCQPPSPCSTPVMRKGECRYILSLPCRAEATLAGRIATAGLWAAPPK